MGSARATADRRGAGLAGPRRIRRSLGLGRDEQSTFAWASEVPAFTEPRSRHSPGGGRPGDYRPSPEDDPEAEAARSASSHSLRIR